MRQNQTSPQTPPEESGSGNGPPLNPQAELIGTGTSTLLGFYFVALGLVLIYLTVVIWPPDYKVATNAAHVSENEKDVPSPIIFYRRTVLLDKQLNSGTTTLSPTPGNSPGRSQVGASPTSKPSVSNTVSPSPGNSPERPQDAVSPTSKANVSKTILYQANVSYDRRLLLLVMVVSALGSFIHIVSSFVDFVGNRRLTRSWVWWYLLRPYVGVPMAVLFYFVVRAGFLSSGVSAGEVNRFGIAAVAGLVGMFSVKAGDKLKELFDTLFKTETPRKDALTNPLPVVQSIKPSKQVAGAQSVDVVVSGSGFIPTSVVKVGNVGRETQFRNPKELSVKLLPEDIAKAGTVSITVTNPPPGGGDSAPAVLQLENPAPVITSIESIEGGTKLRIVGSGFMADSVASVNGVVKSAADTSFVNATELTIAHRSASGDKIELKVSNPEPGGGTSEKSFIS